MTPEARAREVIDSKLAQAGWQVRDLRELNPCAAMGVAVRQCPTGSGPAAFRDVAVGLPAFDVPAARTEQA